MHLDAGVTAVFARNGLTAADFLVVVTLRRSGLPYRMPQARLMNALELTSGTVSVRLDRLVRLGFVVREQDPDNARSTLVRLTEAGAALFDVVAPDHLANEDRLLSALSEPERLTLGVAAGPSACPIRPACWWLGSCPAVPPSEPAWSGAI